MRFSRSIRAKIPPLLAIVLFAALANPFFAQRPTSNLPAQRSPIFGGAGGVPFVLSCGPRNVLTGLRARADAFVFAIGITCRSVLDDGSLGPESVVGEMAGGTSGAPVAAGCATGRVLSAVDVHASTYVQSLVLYCRGWDSAHRRVAAGGTEAIRIGQPTVGVAQHRTRCEFDKQPMTGVWGRAQSLVDAIGFVCDEPR
ncbi:MAG: hypothetical protein AB1762_18000 [Gemmatimonadota bacterium]